MEKENVDYNKEDDMTLFLILVNDNQDINLQEYIIKNYQSRLDNMDKYYFLKTLSLMNKELIEKCPNYIYEKILNMQLSDIESLLYENKNYHEITDIAKYLKKQEWFNKEKYKAFIIGLKIEELLNKKNINLSEVLNIESTVLTLLKENEHNTELIDMIIKNYFLLLNNISLKQKNNFIEKGYKAINNNLESDKEITSNMMIFMCHSLVEELKLERIVKNIEFYHNPKDKISAYYHATIVRVNLAAIKECYKMFKSKKDAFQYIFYILSHELDHAKKELFTLLKEVDSTEDNEELRIHNAGISECLQEIKTREFYYEYHDCFSHEFSANIKGIETLYNHYKYFKAIKDSDKISINRFFAGILVSSYVFLASSTKTYAGPVEFSRLMLKPFKNELPGYAKKLLFNNQFDLSEKLKVLENSLSEEEKLKLGYYTPYIGVIDLVANDKIKVTNLFENLDLLYQAYYEQINKEYLVNLEKENRVK